VIAGHWLILGLLATVQAGPARTHLVIVGGLGGSPEHSESFHNLAIELAEAAETRYGLSRTDIHYLGEDPDRAPERMRAKATRENVERTIGDIALAAGPDDRTLIVLIGHGSYNNGESRFNLPGPDLTAVEFGVLLDRFGTRPLALVNCASSSGEFIAALSGPGRIIVTATRSGRERNETVFARFFVEAFTNDSADLDKDERISLLEAFQYARRLTSDYYERGKQMLTEHALLDDNGDGEGSAETDVEQGDGLLARSFYLEADPAAAAAAERARGTDPELVALYERRREFQTQVEALRIRKSEMDPEEYTKELERLLVELARVNQEIRKRGGGV
jgi:hypothetical protein